MSGCSGHGHAGDGGNDGHQGCSGSHDHDAEFGLSYSLYKKIDIDNVECLNEAAENSGKSVFKPWEDRLSMEKFVESDVDEELLYNIPFTDQIKLKGIIVRGGEYGHHPSKMRLFKNCPHLTFEDVQGKADQEFDMNPDSLGTLEYNPKIVTFSSVTHLTIHFPSNFGEEITKIYYIGFKGEHTKAHRHGVTLCNYEQSPQLSDHKGKVMDSVGKPVM